MSEYWVRESGSFGNPNRECDHVLQVWNLCAMHSHTEDAKEAYWWPKTRNTWDTFHVGARCQQHDNDWSGPRLSELIWIEDQQSSLCSLSRGNPVAIFFFSFCGTTSSVSLWSTWKTMSNSFAMLRIWKEQETISEMGETSKRKSAIMSTNRTDLFKTLANRGRTCGKSIANRLTDGISYPPHQDQSHKWSQP